MISFQYGDPVYFAVAIMGVAAGLIAGWLVFRALRAGRRQSALFRTAMDNLPQGFILFDGDERISIVNRSLLEMYNLSPEVAKPGCRFIDYLHHRVATGLLQRDPYAYRAEILERISDGSVHTTSGRTADGRTVAIVEKGVAGGGWVVTHEDITVRVELEAKLAHQARHDALTDLPNRVLLRDRVQKAIGGNRSGDRHWALHMLDLDRFKEINDTLGHSVGDRLLIEVAKRIKASVREEDTVARLGGDEFVILQALPHDDFEAEALANRLIDVLARPFEIEGNMCQIGVSIGIAISPRDGDDLENLLKNADMALYRSKDLGRGVYHFFERSFDELAHARREMEMDLRNAIERGEFELHFQPQLKIHENRICCFEALLRWRKPGAGLVPPGDFIPLAEETGLILAIGDWVLKAACAEAMTWPGAISVAVNVSPVQFRDPAFIGVVQHALESSGLPANRLELEVTESLLLEESARTLETLAGLREIGVTLALDDFGTGYSSLTTLRKYPFEKIKIDRSFIGDLDGADGAEGDAEAIVRSVASLGLSLGLATTAEGVETPAQLDRVRALGCDEVQGFLIARPVPASEIAGLLDSLCERSDTAA